MSGGFSAYVRRVLRPVMLAAAGVTAYGIRHGTVVMPPHYWGAILAGVGVFVWLRAMLPSRSGEGILRRLARVMAHLALTGVVLVLAAYFLKVSIEFSRIWSVIWLITAWLGLAAVEMWIPAASPRRRIILAGDQDHTLPIRSRLEAVGSVEVSVKPLAELIAWLRDQPDPCRVVDEIIVVGAVPDEAVRSALILALHGNPVDLRYCVDLGGLIPEHGTGGFPGHLTVPLAPSRPLMQRVVKRTEDLILILIGLPVVAPAMAGIAILLWWDEGRPILFRQRRLGLGGKAFTILKFRTMTETASDEAEAPQVEGEDHRVTGIGRFLRRYGLDELPQILNVLKGDMSLVGPRPHAFPHDVTWSEMVPGYARRFEVPPGITGLAQVRGYRGFVEDRNGIEARLALDLEYIRSWSLWLDAKILSATFSVWRNG